MRILHTADWHIGQLFHEYDRTPEHQAFLDWLIETLVSEEIDVLLISGDVFDISNPAAASVKMFYTFLNRATKGCPHLQVIITAGNHDSASRLEAPKPLLESSNVHIVGLVEKLSDGSVDYGKLCIPVYDKHLNIKTWCLAIPFLRMGDYPSVADCTNPYSEGVAALYNEAFEFAKQNSVPGQSIIAMGHLHTHAAEVTELDKTERLIMGGVECVPATAFHPDIKYVALGHIHKAQQVSGKAHVRYSGSVLPMSFSELNYKHQVVIFDLDHEVSNMRSVEIPEFVPLQRIPLKHQLPENVLPMLQQLPDIHDSPERRPYLEVRILLQGPEPALRHRIETALAGKNVRLAKIDVRYPAGSAHAETAVGEDNLQELQPIDVFGKIYRSKYNTQVPEEMLQLFRRVSEAVTTNEPK